jgi:hypothetical protein
LVQPQASPQRHQICDARSAAQRRGWEKSVNNAGGFMSRPGNSIQDDGHDPRAAGVSRGWSGSIRHHIQRTLKPLPWLWPLDQRQQRHLSWQSPEVTREDGVARKFGSGHNSELIWRAFHHADRSWEGKQIPAYREELISSDDKEALLYL